MAAKQSAGLLLYKKTPDGYQVLLGHPGGPFWARRDDGVWSIPKGEFTEGEEPLKAARREFREEMGSDAPEGPVMELDSAKMSSGKVVYSWALEADLDTMTFRSNSFKMEWPPKSGQEQEFPELDRVGWFTIAAARQKLVKGQVPLLERLTELLHAPSSGEQTSLL
ncbi:MAG TPA: NUDIX domain-containing protein [Candidatus Saccharimonadales bacterium]